MKQTVYIMVPQCKKVKISKVYLGDVVSIFCNDGRIEADVKTIKIHDFNGKKNDRVIISALKITEEIQKRLGDVDVVLTGETDVLIEFDDRQPKPAWLEYMVVVFVCLIVFFGAGFTIMAFNKDVDVHSIFAQYYKMVMGKEYDGFSVLEVGYSVGLAIGIIVFYNHFGKVKITKDPTPLEVEMNQYQEDIHKTLIDSVYNKGDHIDVD